MRLFLLKISLTIQIFGFHKTKPFLNYYSNCIFSEIPFFPEVCKISRSAGKYSSSLTYNYKLNIQS